MSPSSPSQLGVRRPHSRAADGAGSSGASLRSLRILAVAPCHWPCLGGGERLLGTILERLAARGHSPSVLTTDAANHPQMYHGISAGLPAKELRHGVEILRLPPGGGKWGRLARRVGRLRGLNPLTRGWAECIRMMPSPVGFVASLQRLQADVVLAANWGTAIPLLGAAIGRLRGLPVVSLPYLHIVQPWASRPVLRSALPLCACTVALTPSEAAHARSLGARRTAVIGGGIEAEWGRGADGPGLRRRLGFGDAPVVAFVGRQDTLKGTPNLIAAMRLVWRQRPEAFLLLAGPVAHRDPATWAALSTLTPQERARVSEVNDFSEAEAPSVFAACDLLAQPSTEESFGLVLLEAWMMGRPVVGADIPATRDLVQAGEDGLIVPPSDPTALTEAILQLIASPERRARFGAAGRAKVLSRYTTTAMIDAWEWLLTDVVASAGS